MSTTISRGALLSTGVLFCVASGAYSAPLSQQEKAIAALSNAAQSELDQGHFERAADLFLQLWRKDATLPVALLNAARSSQLAGQWERADELYREFLALPNQEPARLAKARRFYDELRSAKAQRKAEEAARAERDGRYDLAAALWTDAFDLDRTRLASLARLGRAQHLAGKGEVARATYRKYLDVTGIEAPDRADVQRWLAELPSESATTPTPAVVTNSPGSTPTTAQPPSTAPAPGNSAAPPATAVAVPTVTAHASNSTPWRAVALTATGGTALLAGAGLLAVGLGKKADYEAAVGKTDAQGNILSIDHDTAREMAQRAETYVNLGFGVAGVGAVAAGVGLWLWLREPAGAGAVALPVPGGMAVAVRF